MAIQLDCNIFSDFIPYWFPNRDLFGHFPCTNNNNNILFFINSIWRHWYYLWRPSIMDTSCLQGTFLITILSYDLSNICFSSKYLFEEYFSMKFNPLIDDNNLLIIFFINQINSIAFLIGAYGIVYIINIQTPMPIHIMPNVDFSSLILAGSVSIRIQNI